ncbi:MAG: GNAT family N-acetyltransferase [Bryobacteraceae bacterium]
MLTRRGAPLEIIDRILRFGEEEDWRYLELRGAADVERGAIVSDTFFQHTLSLEGTECVLFAGLDRSHRRNVRKAVQRGVEVQCLDTQAGIDEYFRLHCVTRRRHGLPPQPYRFFRLLHDLLIRRGLGIIVLARAKGRYVAGAVCLNFNHNAIYKYGASDGAFHALRPNNLVIWQAIRYFRAAGAKTFSFGRTDPADEGLLRFKRGWGAHESSLLYHRIPIGRYTVSTSARRSLYHRVGGEVFRRLPIPVLRTIGCLAYPHLG